MKPDQSKKFFVSLMVLTIFLIGCESFSQRRPRPREYAVPTIEADWIRNGEPLEFEGALWHPVDTIENLFDAEVYPLGQYQGVEFFVEKIDVRPYDRLYTKFGQNKFRVFKRERADD